MCDVSEAIPRLGIKKFNWWSEALHGYASHQGLTVFPEPIGMAASFDDGLVYKVFNAVSDEIRAFYNDRMAKGQPNDRFNSLSVWTPNINIFRDPRWGRGQETYGEDPYLTSRMGVSVVKGLQGPSDTKYMKLLACAKHFAVHSGPESTRHTANLNNIDPRDLWETYLPAFKALVTEAGVREVMCAYQRLDDEPCCGNSRLLQQILRNDWGFKHMVVSDCGAIADMWSSHKSSSDAPHASAKGVLAGTDVECGWNYTYMHIPEAVAKGLITEKDVDTHVIRLLTERFDLGEMDDPSLVSWSKLPVSLLHNKEHQQLAVQIARETMTLLQNKNNILPLRKSLKVAVIGPNADRDSVMWGNYCGTPTVTVTVLDGIKKMIGGRHLIYDKCCPLLTRDSVFHFDRTLAKVKDADVVIFVGGISSKLEGEEMPVVLPGFKGGDRTSIELPAVQRACLKALKAAGKKVVFVNLSGSAIALTPETESCDAILQAWYGGESGGQAVAEVLFGEFNPSGKLPVTFYRNTAQLPDFEDYSMKGRTYRFMNDALFPFGYGLSYTSFNIGVAKADRTEITDGTHLTIPVTNAGKRNGAEVVQIYMKKVGDSDGPLKTLRAFKRVDVPAGKTVDVSFDLPSSTFECFDHSTNTVRVAPGDYLLYYGTSSSDKDLKSLKITIK
jgi:beta-glucosidase